ncbi:MAG: hypothetical protein KDD64_15440 [Bdellovibrionales bacterium]|nr:hypothetical protein [Bdellovibrionales bacterium]
MSFISAQNFIAPLKSKVHLVTIVMVALIFAVWRLNSGDFEVHLTEFNTVKARNAGPQHPAAQNVAGNGDQAVVGSSYPTRSSSATHSKANVERLLTNPASPKRTTKPKESDSSLADIERSLGLR